MLELKRLSRVNVFSLSSVPKDLAVCALSAAIADGRALLISYKVKFNDYKTEFIIGTRQQLSKVDISSVKLGSSDIFPLTSESRCLV